MPISHGPRKPPKMSNGIESSCRRVSPKLACVYCPRAGWPIVKPPHERYLADRPSPTQINEETRIMAYTLAPAAVREQRPGAAHRRQDDGDPSRQASRTPTYNLNKALEGNGLAGAEHRGPVPQHRERSGRHPRGRAQQRRRARQPLAVLDDHEPQGRRRAERRSGQGDRQRARRLRQVQGGRSPRPAITRFGSGWAWLSVDKAGKLPSRARPTRTTRTWTARRRSWASTCGSTPTT